MRYEEARQGDIWRIKKYIYIYIERERNVVLEVRKKFSRRLLGNVYAGGRQVN